MEVLKKNKKKLIITSIILILVLGGVAVFIFKKIDSNILITKDEAVQIVLEDFPGRAVETKVEYEGLQAYYEITVITDDFQEVEVTVNAKDGQISGIDYD